MHSAVSTSTYCEVLEGLYSMLSKSVRKISTDDKAKPLHVILSRSVLRLGTVCEAILNALTYT